MAHVTNDDIEELGQLVDAGPPDEPTDRCHAVIVLRCRPLSPGIGFPHRTELVDIEELVAPPHAALEEEDRSAVL